LPARNSRLTPAPSIARGRFRSSRLTDQVVDGHFRDAKLTEVYEGTSEIQRLTIASALLSV
jgi:alkylation response protein AidB-like acyl-CoA dehydrogenase